METAVAGLGEAIGKGRGVGAGDWASEYHIGDGTSCVPYLTFARAWAWDKVERFLTFLQPYH